MKKNKKGFISITIIYSFFILFITIMLLIMYSYINDRKMNNKIKSDLINDLRNKAPDIVLSMSGSNIPNPSYDVNIKILDGGNGIASAQYTWSTSPFAIPDINMSSHDLTVTSPTQNGFYFLIVKACDVNSNCKVLYSNFFEVGEPFVCIRARTLHNETCNETDGNCIDFGYSDNSVITYGSFGDVQTNKIGDAYDCDINGDGTYDPLTERFYYLDSYYDTINNRYDNTKATLIYSDNVHNGLVNNTSTTAYTTGSDPVPATAFNELPTSSIWSDVTLASTERNVKSTVSSQEFVKNFSYTGDVQSFTAEYTGMYKIQLWGASGGSGNYASGGKGAYTSGVIELTKDDVLYIYVGGESTSGTGGYNGGGNGSGNNQYFGGGGATDVRLVNGEWNNSESLASRIMVAGGGGGSYYYDGNYLSNGGGGGSLIGIAGPASTETQAQGGTQTAGGTGYNNNTTYNGSFAIGSNGASSLGTGGGGGYYGGGGTYNLDFSAQGAAGGSSYISGHLGCIAISAADNLEPKDGCVYPTLNSECSIHYSDKSFSNTTMIPANEPMPTYDGYSTMVGNKGNGYAIISYIGSGNETPISNTFTYTNKVARMLTYREISKCIDYSTFSFDENSQFQFMNNCSFLLENTKFVTSNKAAGYFFETPTSTGTKVWVVDGTKGGAYSGVNLSTSNKYGVRPVIEVDKVNMQI